MKFHLRILLTVSMFVAIAQTANATPPAPCGFAPTQPVSSPSLPKTMTCAINGELRKALVYAPRITIKGEKLPVVFAFHGHGGNMQGIAQSMHIQTVWPGAIVLYPQGLPSMSTHDPNGQRPGWQQEAGQNGDRDLKLFDAMLATIQQTYIVDDARIYTTGFSNGGAFSYLLWAERGDTLAAIGECAGRIWESVHPKQPRALLAIAGQADTTDPFTLQQQSIETARQVDSATGQGQACGQSCTFYPSTTQTPVKTFIHPGAHVYPPWAPAEIVKFFKNHKRL